jgi:hypothetical protein
MFVPNRKHTVEHLRELTDEVKEFHPILNVLFRKLPGIDRVHYNHGNSELGADFILFRHDPALLRITCIGVVVKADSIKQNTTDVERQIKECFISRKTVDGSEIQIREVWVVSSQDITKNARDVINKLYADKKIEFVPAQDLAGLIDTFAPDAFVTTSPALQEFAETTILSLNAEDQRSLVVPGMEAFYVEPIIIRRSFDGYGNAKVSKKLSGFDELLKAFAGSELSIIQAGAGGGKSRLARELAKRVLESSDFASAKIIPTVEHANEYIDDPQAKIADRVHHLRQISNSTAKVIIFVDGFDEVDFNDSQRRNFISDLIKAASYSGTSVVLLSRPFNEVSILGSRIQSLDVFQIEPLKGPRAIEFLGKIAGKIDAKSKLLSDLNKSALLKALDGTPIAYILLGRLIAENQQDLPSNLTELFQKYSELVLGRWEMAKGLRSQQEYEVLVESLIWLSVYLLDNQLTEIARSEFEEWVERYCKDRGISINTAGLVDRVCGRNSVLYLRTDVMTVGFRHRAFSEFFYAKSLDRKTSLDLTSAVFSPYWFNSYYFLAGIKKDCPDLIRSLLQIELTRESDKVMRALNFGNILLAGYLTPTKICRDAVLQMAMDFTDLFIDACSPSSGSALSNLPTIQMLCVFASSYRSQYGYKYFKLMLEEIIFDYADAGRTEHGAIALFLINNAYKESGGSLRFDDLIESYGESLPLVVKLAIKHESDRMKIVSDRVKRMERNLRRSFSANKGSKEFLHKLYKVPVRQLEKKLT